MTEFKVLHAPLHGVSATNDQLRAALKRGARYVIFTESSRQYPWLSRRPLWRLITGGPKKDARGRANARDISILLRRWRHKHLEHGTIKASDASTPLKIAPARYLSYTVDVVDGKPLAVIGIHPNAAVKDAWRSDRAVKYRESMKCLARLVGRLREKYGKDLDIVIDGDLNHPDEHPRREWAPLYVARKLDLDYVNRGVDWILWSSGLKQVGEAVVIPERENGQDHPWIEVTLRRRTS